MPDATHLHGENSPEDGGRPIRFPGERGPSLPERGLPRQLTSFIGRESEITALEGLLAGEARLLGTAAWCERVIAFAAQPPEP